MEGISPLSDFPELGRSGPWILDSTSRGMEAEEMGLDAKVAEHMYK